MEAHSLYELNEYIRRVVALNFREPVWIKAEASQVKQSRNNFYIDLVEKKEGKDEIIAQANAVLWARNYFFLKKKLGELIDNILIDGAEILIKAKVDFNERYGLKLVIEDIDASYTLGQAELRRQEIVDQLRKEGLDKLNRRIELQPVLQKIAVISSEKAAGYQDFTNQLLHNSFGYAFDVTLFPIAVQGSQTEKQLVAAINDINDQSQRFDCVVIVRGGGSKLDLSWFDTYDIGSAIAQSNLPVFTGIGHEIDSSIADMVAHTNLKTPTAAADFLIENNMIFESSILDLSKNIILYAQEGLHNEKTMLESMVVNIGSYSRQRLNYALLDLEQKSQSVTQLASLTIDSSLKDLIFKENLVESLRPENVLNRGFAILYKANIVVKSASEIRKGERFEVELMDGKFNAERK